MRDAAAVSAPPSPRPRWLWVTAAGLLAVHFALAATSIRHKCVTYDELAHLTRGYSYVQTGDFRLGPPHPPLAHYWAALPGLGGGAVFPKLDQTSWWTSDVWRIGTQFFYRSGNDIRSMLLAGRLMIAVLSVGLGLLVFAWSRSLFGGWGGIVSLTLYAFSPSVLSCASLVTTDMIVSLFFVAALATTWKLLHEVSPIRVIFGCLSMVGLFLSKMSAPLILPVAVVLVLIRLVGRRPLRLVWRGRCTDVRRRSARLALWIGVAACETIVTYAAIWAAYGFRYEAMNNAVEGRDRFYSPRALPAGKDVWEEQARKLRHVPAVVAWFRRHKVLPEAYLYSTLMSAQTARGRASFLNGQVCIVGFRSFFPYCFLVKTPLPLFAVMAIALVTPWLPRGAAATSSSEPARSVWRSVGRGLHATAPLWVFLVAYWAASIRSHLNIGHRHIVPTYPVLFILCGAAAGALQGRMKAMRWATRIAVGLFALASLSAWPHYLAYFNWLVGGPGHAYKHLVDSSLDWGQDLPGLKRWLDRHVPAGERPAVYLSYFGRGDPQFEGIAARVLPTRLRTDLTGDYRLTGGIYCISATSLQQVYLTKTDPRPRPVAWTKEQEKTYRDLLPDWENLVAAPNTAEARKHALDELLRQQRDRELASGQSSRKADAQVAEYRKSLDEFPRLRLARLFAYLRAREPDDSVGYSILIYRLTDEQVREALVPSV